MLKKIYLFLCLGIITGVTMTSCKDDSEEKKNPIEENYFTIEQATYMDGNLPRGSESLITGLEMNSSAIMGGSSIVRFSSSKELNSVNIGVRGVSGYYQYYLNTSKASDDQLDYQLVLMLSQQLTTDFVIQISAVATDGTISEVINSDDIKVIEVGTGKLQISLSWDKLDDVDLHLLDPNGNEIAYWAPYAVNGVFTEDDWMDFWNLWENSDEDELTAFQNFIKGKGLKVIGSLDLDSNAACDIDGINNENITYENEVVAGTYTIAVNLWEKCTSGVIGSTYSVTVNYDGKAVSVSNKQLGKFADTYMGNSDDDPDKFVIIGTFTIGNTKNAAGVSPVFSKKPSVKGKK